MASNEVKLLSSWISPFVLRAKIALNIKRVEFESIPENLSAKSDLLLRSNPVHKKVPVLIHGHRIICESLIIVQYVDEVWASGPGILPSDHYDRATARFWAAYIDEKWYPNLRAALVIEGEEAKKANLEEITQGLALFENTFTKCSKGKKFFGGDTIGYLDIALGCFLAWLRVIERINNVILLDEAKTPRLFRWAHDFSAEPDVKSDMPETDKLFEYSKGFMLKLKALDKKK
ncbi:glutathione S-transferase U17-like [Primulina tabacum]|uniref:glutathione S-transferase U17-like n=1 Tax=Primulina tabacum TaxID=48773 RepID=UPI003F5A3F4E